MSVNKTRKKRAIPNGIVNVDDITCEPGIAFKNWVAPIREKLKSREQFLLNKRWLSTLQSIQLSLNEYISHCYQYFGNDETIRVQRMQSVNQENYRKHILQSAYLKRINSECMARITKELDEWNGVDKQKKEIKNVRQYWRTAKNGVDQKKLKIILNFYFIPLIYQIKKFADDAASQFFSAKFPGLQQKYSDYLYQLTLQGLCNAKIKIPNTRPMVLIAKRTFLLLNDSRNGYIKQLFRPSNPSMTAHPATNSGDKMRIAMIDALSERVTMYKNRFVAGLRGLHAEIANNFGHQQEYKNPYAGVRGMRRCIHCHLAYYNDCHWKPY